MVSLGWDDVDAAAGYELMYRSSGGWVLLSEREASGGVLVAFEGSSAVVAGLPVDAAEWWFAVRARNAFGVSRWSQSAVVRAPEDAARAPLFDPFTAPTRSGIDLERLREAVATIAPGGADCTAAPALGVEGVSVVDPSADLDDPDAELTVAEVARIAGGCLIVEYVALAGRTVAQVRGLLAADASVHAVGEPVRGLRLDHDPPATQAHPVHAGGHHTDTGHMDDEQWHLPQPAMDVLWNGWRSDADAQVIVAVLDTGVDVTHPDFTENEGPPASDDTHLRVVGGMGCHIADDHGHGTRMAGIIAAELDGGHVAGVAPRAMVLPLRIHRIGLDPGETDCFDSSERLAPMTPPVAIAVAVNAGARVLNMSFRDPARHDTSGIEVGGVGIPSDDTYELVLRAASMLGVVAVTSAGNCGDDGDEVRVGVTMKGWEWNKCPGHNAEQRPAIYDDVMAVAGISESGVRVDSSSANVHVDVAAPGEEILTTERSCSGVHCVEFSGGTSAAAAFVSGVVAHMLNRHPEATPGQVRRALEATARHPRGADRDDDYGHGIVDPAVAVAGLGAILGLRMPSGPRGGFVAVSSGGAHTCGLRSNGAVQCWGVDSVVGDVPEFGFVSLSSPPTADYVCGVRRGDGAVPCWGDVPSELTTAVAGSGSADAPEGRFEEVAAGDAHVCGLRRDRGVVCWGDDSSDQTEVPLGRFGASRFRAASKIVAGADHTCAVTDSSDAVCWGDDSDGRLPPSSLPFAVFDVAAGAAHTCVIDVSELVRCWGDNSMGQLNAPAGEFTELWAGADHTCGLRSASRAAVCWGDNSDGRLDAPDGVFKLVAGGGSHNCALDVFAAVWCWGDNGDGQAPQGRLASLSLTMGGSDVLDGVFDADISDYDVAAFGGTATLAWAADGASATDADPRVVVTVHGTGGSSSTTGSAVSDHTVFVQDGSVVTVNVAVPFDRIVTRTYTIRVTARPQLAALSVRRLASGVDCSGAGCRPYVLVPAFDPAVTAYSVVVPPGVDEVTVAYSAADAADSVAVSPPDASSGADGSPGNQVALTTNTGFVSVDAGNYHSCGLTAGGVARCWGGSDYLGQSRVPSGSYVSVSAGWGHSCGLETDDSIVCWGDDYFGQSRAPSGSFASVSAGWGHSCGLTTAGAARCWGYNFSGQSRPSSGAFTAVAAGGNHSCGITSAGTLRCWGLNLSGQASPPSGTFTALAVGWKHNCAIAGDSTVSCWGDSGSGRTAAPAGTFMSVSAGEEHSCGVKTDGTAVCWGNNGSGQATPPAGSFAAVSAGDEHSCGLTTDGEVLCWGATGRPAQPAAPATVNLTVTSGADPASTTVYTVSIERNEAQTASGSARARGASGRSLIDEKLSNSASSGPAQCPSTGSPATPPDTEITLADPVLRAGVERALDKPAGEPITAAELASLTVLSVPRGRDAGSAAITDLSGLEHATALEVLDLAEHDVAALTPLACLTGLRALNLARNRVADLALLRGLASLQRLYLYDNQISDIAPLATLTALTELHLDHNDITTIAALSGLSGLEVLGMGGNQISGIAALRGLTGLEALYLFDNDIADAGALSGLGSLGTLWVDGNDLTSPYGWAPAGGLGYLDARHNLIADVAPLDGLAAPGGIVHSEPQRVTTVRVNDASLRAALLSALGKATGGTLSPSEVATVVRIERVGSRSDPAPIRDLSGLEHATSLTELRLRHNAITDIEPIAALHELERLDLQQNRLADLGQLGGLRSLRWLNLLQNTIASVDGLPALPALETLILDFNHISDTTPLFGRTALTRLGLAGNNITDIEPLASLTGLDTLTLSANDIADIEPLASLTGLRGLYIDGNPITGLSALAGLTKLRHLRLNNNNISDLTGLAGLTRLTSLHLYRNCVTDLEPLRGLTRLGFLDLRDNDITSIEPLRRLTSLEDLYIGDNHITDFSSLDGIANLTIHGQDDQTPPN